MGYLGVVAMQLKDNLDITPDIVNKYYEAMRYANEYFDDPMKEFIKEYPLEYKHLQLVHQKRVKVNSNVEAMKLLNVPLYFGTLTYDETKDHNKIESKRKEAFMFLNSLFSYVLLVEEYGEVNERYHVHFVGAFREGKTFEDFTKWHSRQNLKQLSDEDNISRYLCKYITKQVPRIRRNKRLIALEKEYKKRKPLKRTFPTLFNDLMNKNIFLITIDDL